MNIAYTCRMCRQPHVVEIPEDSDPKWVRQLSPMLTCNPCYDRRQRFVKSTTNIINLCWKLFNVRESGNTAKYGAMRPKVRELLSDATRAYAIVMAEYRGLSNYVWAEEWVEDFMAKPDTAAEILRNYRNHLRSWRPT